MMFKEKQYNFTRKELEDLYLNKNLSVREVAKHLNVNRTCIEYLITQKYKIKKPKELVRSNYIRNRYYSDKWKITKEQLCKLYLKENLTQNEIAKRLGVKYSAIKSLLATYRIKKDNDLLSEQRRVFYISKEDFIELYINQNLTVKQMCNKLGCSTDTLRKIRKKYDIAKPSILINQNLSKGTKGRISPMKGKHFSEEHRHKISEKLKGNKNPLGRIVSEVTREKMRKIMTGKQHSKESVQQGFITKKIKGTINTSSPEKVILEKLKARFDNVKYQYTSSNYPFFCDFYVPEKDLYIEYQGMWVHGKRPYNEENSQCLEQFLQWSMKSNSSSFYKKAIKTWTISDPLKRETARRNNLNWIEFFNMKQFDEWYKKQ